MKLKVFKFGKIKFSALSNQEEVYEKRLKKYTKIVLAKDDEKTQIQFLESIEKDSVLILFDEKGNPFSSEQFASKILHWIEDRRMKCCYFVVGGPFGFCEQLKKRADCTVSLSLMIFTSDLAWLIVWEQLYRAEKILSDAAHYHHN